jgi:membrane protein
LQLFTKQSTVGSRLGVVHFFAKTLWELDSDSYRGFKRFGVRYLQIMVLVVKNFREDNCLLRASALSFTTILSIVPFFALTFAVLKGLGVQNKLEPYILNQVAAGSHEIVDNIVTYINNTNMTSIGAIGLVTLLVTVITLLDSIEDAFNVIWGVRETRSFYRKFSDYLSVLISGPLLLLAAISITTSLQSQTLIKWVLESTYLGDLLLLIFRLIPYFSVWLAFFFLYIFIPNTKVRFRSALLGGILAGTVWQLAQWGYIHSQVGVAKYNAIYGTLALLPIFMVWIYTSWLIVLFGVEVVAAHQNIKTFRQEVHNPIISQTMKELLALSLLREIATAFYYGRPACNAEHLAEQLDVSVRLVRDMLTQLAADGYLVAMAGEEDAYQPARELDQITIAEVLFSLRNCGVDDVASRGEKGDARVRALLAESDAAVITKFGALSLKELIPPSSPPDAEPPAAGSPFSA